MNILIIFLSGIGNMILFIPTLRAIRNKYPEAKITLLNKVRESQQIIEEASLVDEIMPFYHVKFFPWKFWRQIRLLWRLRKEKFDLIITTFDSRGYKLALFVLGLAGKRSIGYRTGNWYDFCYTDILEFAPEEHEVMRHLKIASFLGINVGNKDLEVYLTEEDKRYAEIILQKNGISNEDILIGIHPGSSQYLIRKRWAPEKFAQVADYLSTKYQAKGIIFGGKDEIYLGKRVANFMKVCKVIILTGKTSIGQTKAIISRCKLFISNDTGLMHIAAAAKVPVIAIFGPTDVRKNAPYGHGHSIVRKNLPCSPCSKYTKHGCKRIECLEAITADDVIKEVKHKLISLREVSLQC